MTIGVYRTVTNFIFIVLISVWLYVDFECWKCTPFEDRQLESIFSIFIYVWITVILSPICMILLVKHNVFMENTSTSRDIQQMIDANNYNGILEMQLYKQKYDIYDMQNNKTLLMLAVQENKPTIISYLVGKNNQYNQIDTDGKNILDYYVQSHGHNDTSNNAMVDTLRIIYEKHPNLHSKHKFTIFLLACYHNNLQCVQQLITLNDQVLNEKTEHNFNASDIAYLCNHQNIVKYLQQKHNMKPNICVDNNDIKSDETQINILDCVIEQGLFTQTSSLMHLYQQNQSLRSTKNLSVFLCACYIGNIECVKQLIQTDINVLRDVCIYGGKRRNGANVAQEHNHIDICHHLKQNGLYPYIYNAELKIKILLLGAALVGKSTLLKQFRHRYGREFDTSELQAAKPHLTQNCIEAMRTLAIYSSILADQGKDTRVCDENLALRDSVARMSDKQKFTKEHYDNFQRLWQDTGIRNTLEYRNEFQITDPHKYLFEHMHEYWKDDYIPSFEDLIHSRQRTTGVNKIKFIVLEEIENETEEIIYEIFDVGGVKNERRKWMHFFDNTSAIIYLAALSGNKQKLW
eukprot:356703_1